MDLTAETEDQAELRLLRHRARRNLTEAPDLLAHVRAIAISGRTEKGETLPEWAAPMRITAADDSDSVYAQLINWVGYWSEQLKSPPPSATIIAWSNARETQGFQASTTVEGAHLLTAMQTLWLAARDDLIAQYGGSYPGAAQSYWADVDRMLRDLRSTYPLAPRPPRLVHPRPCPSCGVAAVSAEWNSEDIHDVQVWCSACGHVIPADSYAGILEWLE
ncbi:hypothetical protein [Agromyces larvae]|uniref:Uncharacterized protein n=1 Tax=Agromyces larvae TaxID=2929802 RepID=A0ABY4C9X9_9MICO|nr:hypothetical protein [Agromyces larvae]UOE45490.1 hypothetical protein MTO99_06955 [Agromyces larvae]